VPNEQKHAPQFRGAQLKFTHTPPRQTWLVGPPHTDVVTQRHVSAGTPEHELPPLPLPPCP
jgi:hypothetical protein